ncbi:hypothetical protein Pflav_032150 [Phytohabitans flavus]|uniref:Uncharacterized protein n=1 Tax=Phytohabitans flavus TaxID=1076124 RepID=A0A6F8XSJ5_9ACTN|nr:RidA family protein [Phytohabitans flavus]BCB76805.1 hypothetical protein Pflav_032150 [Phytohabitans flavus]
MFVSGQASVDEAGRIVPGTFEEEMRRSIDNVRRVLAAEGLTLADVVKVNAFVRDEDRLGSTTASTPSTSPTTSPPVPPSRTA